jgi:CDP-glycerol glycerophosphotransferase (TagB/SpsB family)
MASGLPINDTAPGHRADKVLVWNKEHRDLLLEKGANSENITVTGSPLHDMIFHKDCSRFGESKDQILRGLAIGNQDGIIMFATQPLAKYGICSVTEQRCLTEMIVETCARLSDCHLVIKLHPRESIEDYAYLAESPLRDRFRLVADNDIDLYSLLEASRVVLNQDSTVGIDAVLCDKDLITISLLTRSLVDYAEFGASFKVSQWNELAGALDKVLHDEAVQKELRERRRDYIARFFPHFDGKATERVVDLIHWMLSGAAN